MVLYFTGTGNSYYAARRIAKVLGDELLSMNERIRSEDTSPVEGGEQLVIVVPTYAWRIPRIVRDWLHKMSFPGAVQAWFVMTCGSEIGNAAKYNHMLCKEKHWTDMGTAQIVMPENYIALFNAPQAEEARRIVEQAEPDIDRAAAVIAQGRAFAPPRRNFYDRVMSGPVNPLFYQFIVKDKTFTADDKCTSCGECVRRCPVRNIALAQNGPVWKGKCTHCMACICYCPVSAIEYGAKSRGKPRYHFEAL